MTDQVEMNWSIVKAFWPQAKTVAKGIVLIVLLDMALSLLASFVFDDAFYFKKYIQFRLYDDTESYRQITQQYFDGSYKLEVDSNAGWVNQSNYQKKDMLWSTDYMGARALPAEEKQSQPSPALEDENLVLLVGSSVLSGYRLPYEQAPVARLEEKGYNAFSFGTIMYSVDQTYAFYKEVLAQYKPKVLVVGIHNDPEVISNMFVPFRLHDMSVPFLKPSYFYEGDQVVKKQPPLHYQRNKLYNKLSAALEKGDAYYHKFALYKYMSMTPVADMLRKKWLFAEQQLVDKEAYVEAFELQKHFMQKIVDLASENDTEVIFVKFSAHEDQERPWHMYFYNPYRNNLHNALLKETSFNIIYTSEMFAQAGRPLSDFYQGFDTVHFSADACQLLAEAIHQKVQEIHPIQVTSAAQLH